MRSPSAVAANVRRVGYGLGDSLVAMLRGGEGGAVHWIESTCAPGRPFSTTKLAWVLIGESLVVTYWTTR